MNWQKHKERFARKVIKTDGCWLWQGKPNSEGYGRFQVENLTDYAHRWAYYFEHGSQQGLFVLHRCDNRLCIRPDHLFLGTTQDNTRDACMKGRHTGRPRVVSLADREKIRAVLATGLSQRAVGRLFHCSQATVSEINRGLHEGAPQ